MSLNKEDILESLQALGFSSVADYEEHHRIITASKCNGIQVERNWIKGALGHDGTSAYELCESSTPGAEMATTFRPI